VDQATALSLNHSLYLQCVLADLEHRSEMRQGRQRILVVEIDGYACAVPYVIDGKTMFLKTIYRSRELQKFYGANK
jgi:hypothetical protein